MAETGALSAHESAEFADRVAALAGRGEPAGSRSLCDLTALALRAVRRTSDAVDDRVKLVYAQALAATHDALVPDGFLAGAVDELLALARGPMDERHLAECARVLMHVCCDRQDWPLADLLLHAFDDRELEGADLAVENLARTERWRRLGLPDQAATTLQAARTAAGEESDARVQAYLDAEELAQLLATDRFDDVVARVAQMRARDGQTVDDMATADRSQMSATALLALDRPDDALTELSGQPSTWEPPTPRATWLRGQVLRIEALLQSGRSAEATADLQATVGVVRADDLDLRASLASLLSRLTLAQGDPTRLQTTRREVLDVLAALRRRVQHSTVRPGGVGFLHFEAWAQLVGDAIDLTLALDPLAVGEALDVVLWVQSVGSLQRRLQQQLGDSSAADATAAEDGLPGNQRTWLGQTSLCGPDLGIVLYWPSRYGGHLFTIAPDGDLAHETTGARTELEGICAEFMRELLRLRPDEAHLQDLARTTCALVMPAAVRQRIATWRGFTFCGNNFLKNLAIEALLPPDSDRLLGQSHAVATLAALPVVEALEARRLDQRRPQRQLALFANIAPSPLPRGAEPLALSNAEIAALTSTATAALVRSDDDLSPQDLAQSDLASFAIVHLMAHASEADFGRETLRGLALTADQQHADGVLREDDVLRLHAPGVVVLSACSIGLGPRRLGDDQLANLGNAFIAAGAHTLVQSRAPLRKSRVAALWGIATPALLSGHSTAEALRQAREALAADADGVGRFHDATIETWGLAHIVPWGRAQAAAPGREPASAVGTPAPAAGAASNPDATATGPHVAAWVAVAVALVGTALWLGRRRAPTP
ncbi:MAG: CHAT domain-containing protein [Planctomycetota bacterium]